MPETGYGATNLGTPIGDRKSLEQKAREINLRERQMYIAKMKQKNPDWKPKEEDLVRI